MAAFSWPLHFLSSADFDDSWFMFSMNIMFSEQRKVLPGTKKSPLSLALSPLLPAAFPPRRRAGRFMAAESPARILPPAEPEQNPQPRAKSPGRRSQRALPQRKLPPGSKTPLWVQAGTQLETKTTFPPCRGTGGLFCSAGGSGELQKKSSPALFPVVFFLRACSLMLSSSNFFFLACPLSFLSMVFRRSPCAGWEQGSCCAVRNAGQV